MNPSGVGPGIRVGSGVRFGSGVRVGSEVRVGSGVRVAARAGSVGDKVEDVLSASNGISEEIALFGVVVIVGVGFGVGEIGDTVAISSSDGDAGGNKGGLRRESLAAEP